MSPTAEALANLPAARLRRRINAVIHCHADAPPDFPPTRRAAALNTPTT